MEKKILLFLGFLGMSVVLLISAMSISPSPLLDLLKFILFILAMLFDILALVSRYYTPYIIPMFAQRTKRIVLSQEDAYWLSSSQDSILRKSGDDFIATVYINIPIYRSATEMSPEEKVDFSSQIGRLVGLSKEPVRFTTQLFTMNKDLYIMQLRGKVNELENAEVNATQAGSDPKTLERIRGELSMWRNMLDSINTSQSLELATYASVSASGTKEYEAVSIAEQKATELMSGISTIFGVTPSLIVGSELLKFLEPEFLIPYSTISERLIKGVEEQVV
ncbi:MAG: hypothetical protein QXK65_01225 [Candidatus Micrarchaeaceae archaeon]